MFIGIYSLVDLPHIPNIIFYWNDFQFNDVLLYTTPVATGYKLKNVLPLAGMKVKWSVL